MTLVTIRDREGEGDGSEGRGRNKGRGERERREVPQLPNKILLFHFDGDNIHHLPNRGLLV